MAALGVTDFELPEWMREDAVDEGNVFDVLEENWQAVLVFLACGTQWQRSSRDVPIGLRYEALEVAMRHMKTDDPKDAFERIRLMEAAAVQEFIRNAATEQ